MIVEKQNKKLVSKRTYFAYLTSKLGVGAGGFILFMVGSFFAIFFAVTFAGAALSILHPEFNLVYMAISGLFSIVAYTGSRLIRKAQKLEPLAPITRQNAAMLPVAESLVRPSQANDAPLERVLLRATYEGADTPVEELLRPPD